MTGKSVEIICTACGADTLIKTEPVYDGFKKTGEQYVCVSCGHKYASEAEVPFKQKRKLTIFTDADKVAPVRVFDDEEKGKNCRHCRHYTVNPFTQRCGLHNKVVAATDYCRDFEAKEEVKKEVTGSAGGQTN